MRTAVVEGEGEGGDDKPEDLSGGGRIQRSSLLYKVIVD
jgi:hypothetical protein